MNAKPFTVPVKRSVCITTLVLVLPLAVGHIWLLGLLPGRVAEGAPLWLALLIEALLLAVLLLAYVPYLLLSLIMLRLPGPVIEIGPEGLRDWRLSPEVVPWDRIRWARMSFRMFNQNTYTRQGIREIVFSVDGPFRPRLLLWPTALFYRIFAPHPWPLMSFGTGMRSDQLAERLRRYRQPEP